MYLKRPVRFLAVLCCMVLVFSLISGCTSGGGTDKGEQTQSTTSEQKVNEEKDVVDISIWQAGIILDNVEGIKEDRVIKWIEDKFKVRLNLMTGDFEKIKLLISTGQGADIISFPLYFGDAAKSFLKKIIQEDMVYDIGSMVSADPGKYPTLAKISDEKEFKFFNYQFSGYSDKFYSVWSGDNSVGAQGAPIYNMRVMKELGLEIPGTVDEFVAVLRAIKQKKPDIIPFNYVNWKGSTILGELDQIFFTTNGTRSYGNYKDQDKKWQSWEINPTNKEIWRQIQQLSKEGLFDKETFTKEPYYLGTNDFANDKVAVITFACPNANTGLYTWAFDEYKKVHPDATPEDVVMQPAPLKGSGGSETTYGSPFLVQTSAIIPKTSKNPERALELINWFWSDEGQITKFYGLEGVHHTVDSSGNLVLNEAEWKKDTDVWALGGYHGLFFSMVYASGGMVQYDKNGWIEGHRKQVFVQNERALSTPQALYANELCKKWNDEAYTEGPFVANYINLSEDSMQIRTKLNEIAKNYYSKFIFNEIDIDTGWDMFVNEFKAAGSEKYLNEYGKAVDDAQLLMDTIK